MTPRRGKVRDVYTFGDRLLFVATDRISAFDWVLPNGIPDKGRVLTGLSNMWFDVLDVPNHLLSTDPAMLELPPGTDVDALNGRSMVVRSCQVVPVECVVRGYLDGSGWKEYQQDSTVCGIPLPAGLERGSKLPEPIFTPATKAEEGHDLNISFDEMCQTVGGERAEELRELSFRIYNRAAEYAAERGVILADTKFEFGVAADGEVLLVDEVLTSDSSRYWPADQWSPGGAQPSFDKQFVRDWLETTGWDKNSPPPRMPHDIIEKTRAKYLDAFKRLTGHLFPWE